VGRRLNRGATHAAILAVWLLLLALPGTVRAQDLVHAEVRPIAESTVQVAIDSRQPVGQQTDAMRGAFYRIAGWAADIHGGSGAIRQMLVYLGGPSERGRLLGWARPGASRPDVAQALNNPTALNSGFELRWPVAEMPLQTDAVKQYALFFYVETSEGWYMAEIPILLATWPEPGQGP
jgi:hypothetical protein